MNGYSTTPTARTTEELMNAQASSIDRQSSQLLSSLESQLKQGGLTGLQNLGNTVIFFLSFSKFNIEDKYNFIVFYEFRTSMFIKYKTTHIVLF